MSRRPTKGTGKPKPKPKPRARTASPPPEAAEVEQLRRDLAEAQRRLREVEQRGADAFLAGRLAELEEARQVARGQAVEAALARSRVEAELNALRESVAQANKGVPGWLLRWAQRKNERKNRKR
jgi:flagellar biosynthesis/type III secretory pathway protein FliH